MGSADDNDATTTSTTKKRSMDLLPSASATDAPKKKRKRRRRSPTTIREHVTPTRSATGSPSACSSPTPPLSPRQPGLVLVASKNLRGQWSATPQGLLPAPLRVDVTSAQSKTSARRRDFSPMTFVAEEDRGRYAGYACMEHYWQSGKKWPKTLHGKSRGWWRRQTKPKRRYPKGKGRAIEYTSFEPLPAASPPGTTACAPSPAPKRYVGMAGYVASRKEVYVPVYHRHMVATESFQQLRRRVLDGENVVVFDFDGPRTATGGVDCVPVDVAMLQRRIADVNHPFGHGYVVAAALAGIPIAEYCAPAPTNPS